jgi:hypothetical protein
MQVADNRAAAQVKEILAQTAITRTPPLPVPKVRQGMFHRDPLAQFGAPQDRQLALA